MIRRTALIAAAAAACLALTRQAGLAATVVSDTFESGSLSVNWDSIAGTTVKSSPGAAAGGSDYYARITNVGTSEGGLGATFGDLFLGGFATDFTISLDFRLDTVSGSTTRQFSFQVSAGSATPSVGAATINLRYENNAWATYTSAWSAVSGLGPVTPGTWNHLVITGTNWGSGTAGAAAYDLQLTNHLGAATSAAGIKRYQSGNPDTGGARSFNFNDAYGNNPGFDVDNIIVSASGAGLTTTPVDPVAYSGIYPHLSVSTGGSTECGIGAVTNWAGKLWYMTYPAHVTTGSPDELYSVGPDLARTVHPEYPGSTNANRYIDTVNNRMFIGSAIIDAAGNVQTLPVATAGQLRGRLTGTGPHLTDPNKVYYMTMEEGLYTVDLSNPASPVIATLREDGNHGGSANLPGVHGKGFYVAQGRVIFSNNGNGGVLAEWGGQGDPKDLAAWTIVDRNKYAEITTRNGPASTNPNATDPVWAVGWDNKSVLLNMRDDSTGTWTRYRLPKGSYTHDYDGGWYTEWPRIRDVGLGGGDYLMNEHGLMYRFAAGFAPGNTGGITPFSTFHKMIVDYTEFEGKIAMAANDVSPFENPLSPRNNSNLMFVEKAELPDYGGRPMGFGGPLVRESLAANTPSEAFLINGFESRVIHLSHKNAGAVDFALEIDVNGDGNWSPYQTVTVGPSGYQSLVLPKDLDAQWIRVKSDQAVSSATAYMHLSTPQRPADARMTRSLAKAGVAAPLSLGVLLTENSPAYPLQFAADLLDADGSITGTGFYRAELDGDQKLRIVRIDDAAKEASVRTAAATTQDFGIDSASVFIDDGGTRYRLPMGDSAFDSATASGWRRGFREVVTEREVMNIHGTFYEVPRDNSGGLRRIRPITTHNLQIFDYASWRGMLVLSGNLTGAAEDEHHITSDDGKVGLWFGNVDDLWKFGAPEGDGGPWKDSAVTAGVPSDPFLMYGYDSKLLDLSHAAAGDVTFTVQVDILADNTWETYGAFTVPAGQTFHYVFPKGYSAHWVRLVADQNTTATAWFTYAAAVPEPSSLLLLATGAIGMLRRRRA